MANSDKLSQIFKLLKLVNSSFLTSNKPGKNFSLDQSMEIHRGRLSFRQNIKPKTNKNGIKFYELCTHDGYPLNLDLYKGISGFFPFCSRYCGYQANGIIFIKGHFKMYEQRL